MTKELNLNSLKLDNETTEQIAQCINLVKEIFEQDLLGVYLYGSSIFGGLQKYSDIDLLVVSNRSTTDEEKTKLAKTLLQISGVYMKSTKRPIEITLVDKSEVNPWHYPPNFDFQYCDCSRNQFESGIIEPWTTKEMPDLAILLTQVLLSSKTLLGAAPTQLLCNVPYKDFIHATIDASQNLVSDLNSDTRNVLLTYARIWSTIVTDTIRSKPAAANWAIDRLPEQYRPVMKRAVAICKGEENENWDDIWECVKPCADFIIEQINNKISEIKFSNNKFIKLAELDELDLPFSIITPRLLIRPPSIDDVLELNTAIVESFDILHEFLSWAKVKPTLDETEEFIRRAIASWILRNGTDEPWLPLYIFDKKSNELVGATGFFNVDWDIPSVETGYWVRTKYANFGFISEALNAVTQYAFKQLHVKRMVISCDKDNINSQKVAQRLNYNLEATLKMHRIKPITGEISDTLVYTRHDLENLPLLDVIFHKI